jgi:hypothetical protein
MSSVKMISHLYFDQLDDVTLIDTRYVKQGDNATGYREYSFKRTPVTYPFHWHLPYQF